MPKRFILNHAVLALVLDMGLTFMALFIAVTLRPNLTSLPFLIAITDVRLPIIIFLLVPFLWGSVFLLSTVYDPRRHQRVVDEFQAVVLAAGLATLVFAGFLYLFYRDFSRWLFIIFVILDLIFLLSWRVLARFANRRFDWPADERRVLIVGAGQVGKQVGTMIERYEWAGLKFVGYLDDDPDQQESQEAVLGGIKDIRATVTTYQVDDVVIALPQRVNGKINDLIVELHELPVQIRVVPDYYSLALYRASAVDFGGVLMINLRDPALNEAQRMIKRLFDLVISGLLVVITLPLMGLTALLIKLDSPGPVLFRQQRVGETGRLFIMYKFRSMIVDAESLQSQVTEVNEEGKFLFKSIDDPRVTRLGNFLRRSSLDELPQFFNVMKGEMSLVGPRPELPWLVANYEPWQRKRFTVPQGLTGWWQVNGRADRPQHLHTEDDLYYIQNYSLWLDTYILLKTILVVLRGTGAY
ncbi:MAG TPA: sugar transferase [candidate division Zixibacteria bacterium]|nr:sugar transferase [candidate division Zixibacteria bacterium]